MGGKAEAADPSLGLLLPEIVDTATSQVIFHVAVPHRMEEVEVDIVRLEPGKLLFKLGAVVGIGMVVELGGQVVATPVIVLERLPRKTSDVPL